jgi:hypothetical protein
MNQLINHPDENDKAAKIRNKLTTLLQSVDRDEARRAADEFPECAQALRRLHSQAAMIESRLSEIPPIDVAVLGPSRHGKSTFRLRRFTRAYKFGLTLTPRVRLLHSSSLPLKWPDPIGEKYNG